MVTELNSYKKAAAKEIRLELKRSVSTESSMPS